MFMRNQVFIFLTTTITGLVFTGGLGSLCFYIAMKTIKYLFSLVSNAKQKYFLFKFQGFLNRVGMSYAFGHAFGQGSPKLLTLLVGDIIIQIILKLFWILITVILFVCSTVVLPTNWYYVPVFLTGLFLYPQFMFTKKWLYLFEMVQRNSFGKEFIKQKNKYITSKIINRVNSK